MSGRATELEKQPRTMLEAIECDRRDLIPEMIRCGMFAPDPADCGNYPIHSAIALENHIILDIIICSFPLKTLIRFKNDLGENALHFAARIGCASAVKTLIKHGWDINEPMRSGVTAATLAFKSGSLATIKALTIADHIDIDDRGKTCWHYAIEDFAQRLNYTKFYKKEDRAKIHPLYILPEGALKILDYLGGKAKALFPLADKSGLLPSEIPLGVFNIRYVREEIVQIERKYGIKFNHALPTITDGHETDLAGDSADFGCHGAGSG